MWTIIFFVLGGLIIAALAGYAVYLIRALQKQNHAFKQAKQARAKRLKESIEIIAKAMQNGDCNLSEGVIRLKMLLDPLGIKLQQYSAMDALYNVVADMPILEARRELKKNERMRLDLQRESSEADLAESIKMELRQLLTDVAVIK